MRQNPVGSALSAWVLSVTSLPANLLMAPPYSTPPLFSALKTNGSKMQLTGTPGIPRGPSFPVSPGGPLGPGGPGGPGGPACPWSPYEGEGNRPTMTMKDKNPDFLFNTLNLYYLIQVYTMKKTRTIRT